MFFSVFSSPCQIARSAYSSTSTMLCVFFVKFMAFWTMSLFRILRCQTFAPHKIFSDCNWFKMFRIYTISVTAKMIQLKAIGNRAFKYLKTEAMRSHVFCSIVRNPITILGAKFPNPTFTNLRDTFIDKFWFSHVLVLPRIKKEI